MYLYILIFLSVITKTIGCMAYGYLASQNCFICIYMHILVHKRMFYSRMNLQMLQHSNVSCNISMFTLCTKMMYYGDFVVLIPYISCKFIFII